LGSAHEARVAINGDACRQATLLHEVGNGLERRFRRNVGPHLRMEQDRRAHIDRIEDLHQMLSHHLLTSGGYFRRFFLVCGDQG
jgi:hypothetical protein